jgi:hypothetical protein
MAKARNNTAAFATHQFVEQSIGNRNGLNWAFRDPRYGIAVSPQQATQRDDSKLIARHSVQADFSTRLTPFENSYRAGQDQRQHGTRRAAIEQQLIRLE